MIFFILVIAFWILSVLKNTIAILCFSILFLFYLTVRFKDIKICFIWFLLISFSFLLIPKYTPATADEYKIIEIKNSYVLASNGATTILLYDIEDPNYNDVYKVETFEEIHSIKNINQFCFQDYMNHKNIYEMGKYYTLVSKSNSIRSFLFSKLSNNSFYRLYFYGIVEDDAMELFSRLSLPFITLCHFIESLLNKRLKKETSSLIIVLISVLFGYLFTFRVSLIRFILFKMTKILFDEWEKSFSLSVLIFICLNYTAASDFAFVFPCCMQMIEHFTSSKINKTIFEKMCLAGFQFYYFHTLDLVLTLLYPVLKVGNCILFVFSLIPFTSFIPSFFSNISFPSLSIHYVPSVLYILVLLGSVYLIDKKKKERYIFILFLIVYPFIYSYTSPFFHIYMIDIGQGDCTLIVEPFQRSVVMIDCGQNLYRDNVEEIVLPVLQDLGIKKIDTCIVTHDDFDHSGGIEELQEKIEIDQIVTDSNEAVNVSYPFYSLLADREAKDENDQSIVSYFCYDELSYLWMGDASVDIEKQILDHYDLDVDVLKLGHHGSNTSSSFAFLDTLRPKLGLISVGYQNKYNHPSNEVVVNCHTLGIHTLQTKDVGMIHIFTWRQFSFFETGNGLAGFL